MFKRILVTTDGSVTAEKGVTTACQLAHSVAAKLTLLHIVDTRPVYADFSGINDSADMIAAQTESGTRVLAKAKALAAEHQIEVDTRLVESSVDPIAAVVLREAAALQSDLIVMGTHGRTGLKNLLLGSVAEAVLHGSQVPVLLVREAG